IPGAEHFPLRGMLLVLKRELAQHEGVELLGRSGEIHVRATEADLTADIDAAPARVDGRSRHKGTRATQRRQIGDFECARVGVGDEPDKANTNEQTTHDSLMIPRRISPRMAIMID